MLEEVLNLENYKRLKSIGICVTCGIDYATNNMTQCSYCRKKSRLEYHNNKEKRLKQKKDKYLKLSLNNLCPVCGGHRDTNFKLCSNCRNKQKIQRNNRKGDL